MIFLLKKQPKTSTIILALFTLFFSGFFLLQLMVGEYSITTIQDKKHNLQQLIGEYENNQADLVFYKKRIKAFDPENLDEDLLEEEMRKKVSFTKPNEVVVILD